jgi:bacterioferritin
MQGNKKVIHLLNGSLQDEFSAIAKYMVHAEMCDNNGYKRLAGLLKKQAIDEMHHAEGLIERILFLESVPQFAGIPALKIEPTLAEQLESDLKDELGAVKYYNDAILTCSEVGDNGTKALFEKMLSDEEGHGDFLDEQLSLIKDLGLATYLSRQMGIQPAGA